MSYGHMRPADPPPPPRKPKGEIEIIILNPTYPEAKDITKEHVWGEWTKDHTKIHDGFVVGQQETICPIWGDEIPYKSVTIVAPESLSAEVCYWIEYVQGCDSIQRFKKIGDGKVAIRSDYMAW